MIGLGLALAQPKRRVLVITGDGEMLMGLGSLATIGVQQPRNLAVVVIDNERYGETGMQATHTAHGVDLAAVAQACGSQECVTQLRKTCAQRDPRDSRAAFRRDQGEAEKMPLVLPPREGALLKARFRRALGAGGDRSADVLPEELERALARLLRRRRVVGAALVAVEAVVGARR